eukprot:5436084-Amphidinium_carterae.3
MQGTENKFSDEHICLQVLSLGVCVDPFCSELHGRICKDNERRERRENHAHVIKEQQQETRPPQHLNSTSSELNCPCAQRESSSSSHLSSNTTCLTP